jgi:ABC-type xylose transport system substrate-binding protein
MMSRKILYVTLLIVLILSLVGCAPKAATTGTGKIKVGLSFSDYATERWPVEAAQMTQLLQKKGYEVITQEADHDVKLQSDQIDNMVSQGVKGLIVIAEDGAAAVTPVDKAVAAGVKVISYDRLIKTAKASAYLSFDNVEVGRQEALGVMTALGLPGSTTWTKASPAKVGLDNFHLALHRLRRGHDRGRPVGGELGCRQGRGHDGEHPHRPEEQNRRGGCLQ